MLFDHTVLLLPSLYNAMRYELTNYEMISLVGRERERENWKEKERGGEGRLSHNSLTSFSHVQIIEARASFEGNNNSRRDCHLEQTRKFNSEVYSNISKIGLAINKLLNNPIIGTI